MTEELVTFETAKLAREKGFDEICRNMWMENDGATAEVSAPDDALMVQSFRNLLEQYKDNISALLKKLPSKTSHPLHNSTLPPLLYTRPTQDLLERWLREVWRISIGYDFAVSEMMQGTVMEWTYKLTVGLGGVLRAAPVFYGTHELAREAALLHALNLLP